MEYLDIIINGYIVNGFTIIFMLAMSIVMSILDSLFGNAEKIKELIDISKDIKEKNQKLEVILPVKRLYRGKDFAMLFPYASLLDGLQFTIRILRYGALGMFILNLQEKNRYLVGQALEYRDEIKRSS